MAHGLDKPSWTLVSYYRMIVFVVLCLDPIPVQQGIVQFLLVPADGELALSCSL